MRRSKRLGLAGAVLLLAVFGAYVAFWFIAAGRLQSGIGLWAQSLRTHDLDLSWRTIHVGGFPLAFRLELGNVTVRDRRPGMVSEVDVPVLHASAAPWNFAVWQLAAPQGLQAATGDDPQPLVRLAAHGATGSIVVVPGGGATLWFGVDRLAADTVVRLAAQRVFLWLLLPEHAPQSHADPGIGIALDVRDLTLPTVPPPFRNPLDEVSLGMTVMGKIPSGPPREAAAAWRDSGGTVELDHLAMRWGSVAVTASGTAALDADLQPIASFSGSIEGYNELMTGLVAAGRVRSGEAQLAGLALGFLAKRGPDGRPQIDASFRIQDGEMFLGPLRLGPAPRIDWK